MSKKKIIILLTKNFDFFYYKNILTQIIRNNLNFELWNLTFFKKGKFKKYQYIKDEIIKFDDNKYKVEKIKNVKIFYKKVLSTKNSYFLSLEPIQNNKIFKKKKFLGKIYKNFGILHTNDDLFINFLNKNYLELESYKPTIFCISKYKFGRTISCLKQRLDKNIIQQIQKQKKIFTGYFFLRKYFKFQKKKKKIVLYLPYYSNLSFGDKNFNYAVAFSKFYENKRKDENLLKFVIKKILMILLIFKSFKAIKIFFFYNEKKVLKKTFEFCKLNNLKLVIKSRKKNTLNNYHYKLSDNIIVDDHSKQDPNYLEELLPKTLLAVCYSSQAIYECVFHKVPVFNINNLEYTLIKRDISLIDHKNYSEFNFKNVVNLINVKDFISKISKLNKNYIPYSIIQRRKYMQKILNFKRNNFGEKKIINLIKKT